MTDGAWIDRLELHPGSYLAERPATRIGTCESKLRFRLPEEYTQFLRRHDGGITFVGPGIEPENGGLHLFGCDRMVEETRRFREFSSLPGMVIFAGTPGAGAYFLALDQAGKVVDTGFGERKVIAGSVRELIERMLATPESEQDQFYWFRT